MVRALPKQDRPGDGERRREGAASARPAGDGPRESGHWAKAPYVCSHTYAIEGMPDDEARALIDEVVAFATRPGMTYAHPWRESDLVIWDNRMTLHRGRPFDSANHGRTIVRTTVAGDGPTVTPSYVHEVEPEGLPVGAVA